MWHTALSDNLYTMVFKHCRSEPYIWVRHSSNLGEYIDVYVNYLAFIVHNSQNFVDCLTKTFKYKLKGTGSVSFHLDHDFFRYDNATMCMVSQKYIEKLSYG